MSQFTPTHGGPAEGEGCNEGKAVGPLGQLLHVTGQAIAISLTPQFHFLCVPNH